MNWSKPTLFFWTSSAIVLGVINMLTGITPAIAGICFLIYTLSLSTHIGNILSKHITRGRTVLGFFILISTIMLLNVAVYYPYQITAFTSIVIFILPILFFAIPEQRHKELDISLLRETFTARSHVLATLGFIVLDVYLFRQVFNARTTDVLTSPWQALPTSFFIVFAIATALLLYLLVNKRNKSTQILAVIHFFLISSIAPIIYTLGYGFDGVIHRVTEQWIATHGFILPKNPFYIGQYGLVVWLHYILQLSVQKIDIYLVPILASVLLPLTTVTTLKLGFNIRRSLSRALFFVLPVLFFLPFHLTTPHNLATLFCIVTIMFSYLSIKKQLPFFIPLLLSIATITIHPLIGVPLCATVIMFTILAHIQHTTTKHSLAFLGILGIAILPTAMFTIYLKLSGNPLPTLNNPLLHIHQFFELFKRPLWYEAHAPLRFELVYAWQWILGPLMALIGIYGVIKNHKECRDALLFLYASIAWVLAAYFLRSWVVFPDVHAFEQGNYPLRLVINATLFLIPFMMYGIYDIGKWIIQTFPRISQDNWYKLFIIGSAVMIMFSLYFTYPQNNPKVHFGGYNITKFDKEAVQWIHNQHSEYNYIVLANSITSVTALETYSFAKDFQTNQGALFYYAIPTGGPLYHYYEQMLYQGQKREYIIDAMNLTQVNTAYFVVSRYWKHFSDIVDGAKQTADSWHVITDDAGDEKMYIFTYHQ